MQVQGKTRLDSAGNDTFIEPVQKQILKKVAVKNVRNHKRIFILNDGFIRSSNQ